jgi:hypothetical protein
MTENISDSHPPKYFLAPEETVELLRVKMSWLYQHSRSCSARIHCLDRGAKQAKSLEELVRLH